MEPLIPSTPPVELPACLNWRTIKVKPGMTGPLILAGPVAGFYTHHPADRTLPCLKRMPRCSLPCPWCRFPTRFTSYTPVIDPNAKKRKKLVVQGGKRTYESVVNGTPGQTVGTARGDGETDTVFFRAWPEQLHPSVVNRFRDDIPTDITMYLLHLWQWRDLTEHYGQQFYPSILTQEIEMGLDKRRTIKPREAHGE